MSQLGVYLSDPQNEDPNHIVRVGIMFYSGMFSLMLLGFFAF